MKRTIKTVMMVLVFVMAFAMTGSVSEAKTDKFTLFVGEEVGYSYIGMGTIKSVKSSKSKVVSAKKYKNGSWMVAKKAGKATVTVKGARGTWKHNITVKKSDFKVNFSKMSGNDRYCQVSVANNTSGYFDTFKVEATFRDASGNELYTNTEYFKYVGKKKTANSSLYMGSYYDKVDLSKTTYKLTFDRDIDYKYKDYSKKVTITDSVGKDKYNNDCVNIKAKTSYKGKGTIYIAYDIFFYDEAGNLLNITTYTETLYKSKKSGTRQAAKPSKTASYKINKRVILKER